MTLSPVPGPTTRRVLGIARRAVTGDTWVALRDGRLYRAPSGSNLLTAIPNFPQPTNTTEFVDLAATDDEIFILRVGSVLRCQGTCDDYSNFTSIFAVPFGPRAVNMCSRNGAVYFVMQASQITHLYGTQRTGSAVTFTQLSADLGVERGEGCFVDDDGDVYVGGAQGVAVQFAAGGSAVEPLNLNGQGSARWISVAVSATNGLLVGGGSGMRVARRSAGTWSSDAPGNLGPILNVALMLSATEFVAAGENASSGAASVYRFDGTNVVPFTPTPPTINVHRGLAVSGDELYLGGNNANDSAYVILHGTR